MAEKSHREQYNDSSKVQPETLKISAEHLRESLSEVSGGTLWKSVDSILGCVRNFDGPHKDNHPLASLNI